MLIKKLLRRIFYFSLLIIGCLALWYHSTLFAPYHFQMDDVTYTDSKIPEAFNGFKIGFISDFDLKTSQDLNYLEKCINQLNQEKCNMVIFGGDLFEDGKVFDEERLLSLLKSIETTDGKFAILGECDFLDDLEHAIRLLEKGGFEVLRNQAHNIYYNDVAITLAGMETSGNVDDTLTEAQKNNFVIAAVHQPDYFTEISTSSATLQLSGHSGGGFINIPFLGPTTKVDGASLYTHGHYKEDLHHLYITNGVGMGHEQKLRFNCSPGALIVTLNHPSSTPETQNTEPQS